jgi:hypothetical protein
MSDNIFLQQYRRNYTSVVVQIKNTLRPKDHLILQTQHQINDSVIIADLIPKMNNKVRNIACLLKLPVYDVESILSSDTKRSYLTDLVHQDWKTSRALVRGIIEKKWSYVKTCPS